ncbi:MAG TPA: CPBP family intramembrane glutamic endopeptidase [Granulicella sp.]|nr:CPBP family intramembrane glutamic endopeptidase [Granulicella sp.]
MATDSVTIIGLENAVPQPGRRRDGLELAIGFSLILLVIWTPRPWQRVLYCLAATFLIVVTCSSFESTRAMGLRTANLLRSLWLVGLAVVVASAVLLVAERMKTLHPGDVNGVGAFFTRYWGYALWAFAQQILLQDFFLRRTLRLVSRPGIAVLLSAGVFSIAHLPNPILTLITFFWGVIACSVFLRYRNLYPLWLTHALLGITIAVSVPGPMIRNMRVGLGYLTYVQHDSGYRQRRAPDPQRRQPHGLQRNQADQTVSTRAWVKAEAPTRRS